MYEIHILWMIIKFAAAGAQISSRAVNTVCFIVITAAGAIVPISGSWVLCISDVSQTRGVDLVRWVPIRSNNSLFANLGKSSARGLEVAFQSLLCWSGTKLINLVSWWELRGDCLQKLGDDGCEKSDRLNVFITLFFFNLH